ncbi:hypothetical protein NQ314_003873 [Rhamnusium bicolor]|uniref:Uncharacterized protein n=1 Tax=Rhamnusium bicolor TaxID=1586634 RepID=A0AAV8ZNC5_9CUCU|nr:hypothetical protein NQ314_003873 [Rhamnusium bicolor]
MRGPVGRNELHNYSDHEDPLALVLEQVALSYGDTRNWAKCLLIEYFDKLRPNVIFRFAEDHQLHSVVENVTSNH